MGDLNTTYYLGPELENADDNTRLYVKMEVLTANKMATIYNTIGILEGEEEPGLTKLCRARPLKGTD